MALATSSTRAVGVVEHGQVGGQQHRQLGQPQVVRGRVAAAAPSGARRRRRGADQAAGQRRQARQRAACAAPRRSSRSASSGSPPVGTPTGGSPSQCAWPSRSVSVAARARADEGVARPDAAVLGRLQQEGARRARRPACGRAPTGVSPSASSRRATGMTRRSRGQRAEGRRRSGQVTPSRQVAGRRRRRGAVIARRALRRDR